MEDEALAGVDAQTLQAGHRDGLRVELHVADVGDVEGGDGRLRRDGVRQQDQLGTVPHPEVLELAGAGVEREGLLQSQMFELFVRC